MIALETSANPVHHANGYETIVTSTSDGVGTVLFNRPERRNAYNWLMRSELRHAIASFDADDDVRAVVVGGVGRDFCAGMDLQHRDATLDSQRFEAERAKAHARLPTPDVEFWQMNTPIVAAISGAAVGVGITLTLQMDVRITDEDAQIGFVFDRRGVIPELNAHWLLPRLIGTSHALELLLTGRIFSGREAADIGLVATAVPSGTALERAQAVAADIATNTAPVSAALVKRLVYEMMEEPSRGRASERNESLFSWIAQQPDAVEGIRAFLEKRPPTWHLAKNADFPPAFDLPWT